MERKDLNILLIQYRLSPEMLVHERRCFLRAAHLEEGQIRAFNILERTPTIEDVDSADAVMFGGTGDFLVPELRAQYPEACAQLERAIIRCIERRIPVLSICMQFWSEVMGGSVATDPHGKEVGSVTVHCTDEARYDPLFCDMPESFPVSVGHKDHVKAMPQGAVHLARNSVCPVHAYRLGDRGYFFQFHPELSRDDMIMRIHYYDWASGTSQEELNTIIRQIEETPEAESLVARFVDRIVVPALREKASSTSSGNKKPLTVLESIG
jgi:GMP synthase (glutamine-hydrolysing)